jgi:hypothetical protein
LGESVYGEQLNGAENQRPGSSVNIGALSAPRDHSGSPGAPPTGVSVAALRSPARTGKAMLSRRRSSSAPPPPGLQVNRGTCRFGRYKNPRRPHPPPRASRVSHHPPQVSGLTLAHPCSPTLTRPHPPPSARPIDSGRAGPFLAPGQRGRNGLPRRCRFWVATHRMVD